ncbi:hypothetical protein GCM10009738_26590 [Kitasatospora viridis]|uniref:SCO2583/SCO2584 N-terminal domain-containing protein n=1 Tax=Kitasatospora viridis TaxID=281105 RepID=UPI0031D24F82
MPIADEPRPHPAEEPEDGASDPFEQPVLDESFVRGAAVKEPAARTRMLSARWKVAPPVDPGGRRWSPEPAPVPSAARRRRSAVRTAVIEAVAAGGTLLALGVGPGSAPPSSSPLAVNPMRTRMPGVPGAATDAALPGGGTSDGGECGAKGFHHFALPASPERPIDQPGTVAHGPQLALGSYGFEKDSAQDTGHFEIGLLLAAGPAGRLALSAPLGPQGVAVEIEGPDGLVGGAYGLPVTVDDSMPRTPAGGIVLDSRGDGEAQLVLPSQAMCPGVDPEAVDPLLLAPVDTRNTVTGQPPYRLTVSLSDPAVGASRRAVGSPDTGDVLSADNSVPQ